jgi:hypothetical protein
MSSSRERQCASTVFMVRPASFGWNPQTQASNRFQARPVVEDTGLSERALREFDAAVERLCAAQLAVRVFADRPTPACPDAVFPNNWVSLHADGTAILYPLLAATRRMERRLDILLQLEQAGGFAVRRLVDLTHHELAGRYLEGTGSVVFDHVGRVAYACLSPRTDVDVLQELCSEIGYRPVGFTATDGHGVPIYHTNVMMTIGEDFALVCAEAVAARERSSLLDVLQAEGRMQVSITREEMSSFAGNQLQLRDRQGRRVLVASARGWRSLSASARLALESSSDEVVTLDIPTIEAVGGGSARCMLAEVFLPQRDERSV